MIANAERRYVTDSLEIRGKSGAGATIAGHAAVFNKVADLGWFREMIAAGSFAKTIGEADVRALFNHDSNLVLGRNKAKTLRLGEDSVGLWYEVDLPDTQTANDLAKSIERGDVSQSSFAFDVIKQELDYSDEDSPLRTITEARLYDVSPVTYPAYEDTDVDLKRALRSIATTVNLPFDQLAAAAERGELRSVLAATEQPEGEPREHSLSTEQPEATESRLLLVACDLAELGIDPSFLTINGQKE